MAGPLARPRPRTREDRPGGPGGRPGRSGHRETVQDGVRLAAAGSEDAGYAVDEVEPPSIAGGEGRP